MRTATTSTRRALKAAIGTGTQRAWATAHGVSPVDVSDVLRGHPMSARRENRIRAALALEPLRYQVVELAEGQYVATKTKPRRKVRPSTSVWPEKRARWKAFAKGTEYGSIPRLIEYAVDTLIDRYDGIWE